MLEYFKKKEEKHDLSLLVNMQKQKKKEKERHLYARWFWTPLVLTNWISNRTSHTSALHAAAQPHIYEQKSDLFMFQRHGFKHVHVAPRPRGTASCCCCHHGHVCSCCLCCILLLLFCSYFSLPALASSLYIFFSLASDPVQWVHYTSDVWKYHWTVAIFPYTEFKKKIKVCFWGAV